MAIEALYGTEHLWHSHGVDGEYSERPEHEVRFKCICSSHGSNIFFVKPKETKLNASILFLGVFFKGPFWDPKVFFISWLHYRPKTPVIFVVFEEEFSRPKDAEKKLLLGFIGFLLHQNSCRIQNVCWIWIWQCHFILAFFLLEVSQCGVISPKCSLLSSNHPNLGRLPMCAPF